MLTRKVSVYVFSYTKQVKLPFTFSIFCDELGEVLEHEEKFLTDKSLEDVLRLYYEKTLVFASNFDYTNWYRIVVRDSESRLVKIFKA